MEKADACAWRRNVNKVFASWKIFYAVRPTQRRVPGKQRRRNKTSDCAMYTHVTPRYSIKGATHAHSRPFDEIVQTSKIYSRIEHLSKLSRDQAVCDYN